jgi:predicted transcriptional regulator
MAVGALTVGNMKPTTAVVHRVFKEQLVEIAMLLNEAEHLHAYFLARDVDIGSLTTHVL